MILGQYWTYTVCQDCRAVVTEAAIVSGSSQDTLSPEDIEGLIGSPKPHTRHLIDRAALIAAIRENGDRQEAARDFWAHYSDASDARSLVVLFRRRLPLEIAKDVAFERYLERLGPSAVNGRDRFDWLVAEGVRLAEHLKADREQLSEAPDREGAHSSF